MNFLSVLCATAALFTSLFLFADTAENRFTEGMLQASAAASKAWLSLLDRGQYEQSWDQASSIMKMTISKDEWNTIMNKVRKPLGTVVSREVLDQRTATNPQGLPQGSYIVMFYKTAFSARPSAHELVTLYLEDGEWKVLTYQVS